MVIEKRGYFNVISRDLIFENNWMKVENDHVVNTLNESESDFGVARFSTGAVSILPIDKDNNVYLVKEFKYAIGKSLIQDCGGFIERDEDHLVSAKRTIGRARYHRPKLGICGTGLRVRISY